MRKVIVSYKKLVRHALHEYISGKKNEVDVKIPDYPAVLSHYLHNPEQGPVFGGNEFKVVCDQAIYNYYKSAENKPLKDISQMRLVFDDIPYPSPANPNFTFIDLFAGIGGIRIAFQNAGGKCLFSSEWDTHAQQTYFDNFGEYPFGDIKQFTDPKKVTDKELDKMIPDHGY